MKRKHAENICLTSLITVFMGQIYLSPVIEGFRFSLAVVVLPLLLIYFRNISVLPTTAIIAFLMFGFRAFVSVLSSANQTWSGAFFQYIPVMSYYIIYGMLFSAFKIRQRYQDNRMLHFLMALWICDSSGNIAEAIVRSTFQDIELDKAVLMAISIGLFRAASITFVVRWFKNDRSRLEREQKEKKYKDLLLFTAKLKNELFFLKKSMHDIEGTMNESYDLYNELDEDDLKCRALSISKNIHEIKKDYYRVVVGLEKTLEEDRVQIVMDTREILDIILDNAEKLIASKHKNIILEFQINYTFKTNDYYALISILNNMLVNAIEAIETHGKISIQIDKLDDDCRILIFDNGHGIEGEDLELIFKPGYSTKYDAQTGKLSTGLGLYHVKWMLESHFSGRIQVRSYLSEFTEFDLRIPLTKLEKG